MSIVQYITTVKHRVVTKRHHRPLKCSEVIPEKRPQSQSTAPELNTSSPLPDKISNKCYIVFSLCAAKTSIFFWENFENI